MGKLVLLLADGTTLDVPLTKERMTIGRRADNDICLPHPAVSGEHASVVTILADSFLEDLGSTNGTLVNGKPIVKHFLRDYDQIDIGRQRLVFVSDDNAHVDGLPPDVARNQLMGLSDRVAGVHAAPAAAAPVIGGRRVAAKGLPMLEHDLDDVPIDGIAAGRCGCPQGCANDIVRRTPAATDAPRVRSATRRMGGRVGRSERSCRGGPHRHVGGTGRRTATGGRIQGAMPPRNRTTRSQLGRNRASGSCPDPISAARCSFTKDELSVGRVGMQVAVVRKVGTGFRLVPVEGTQPPTHQRHARRARRRGAASGRHVRGGGRAPRVVGAGLIRPVSNG